MVNYYGTVLAFHGSAELLPVSHLAQPEFLERSLDGFPVPRAGPRGVFPIQVENPFPTLLLSSHQGWREAMSFPLQIEVSFVFRISGDVAVVQRCVSQVEVRKKNQTVFDLKFDANLSSRARISKTGEPEVGPSLACTVRLKAGPARQGFLVRPESESSAHLVAHPSVAPMPVSVRPQCPMSRAEFRLGLRDSRILQRTPCHQRLNSPQKYCRS